MIWSLTYSKTTCYFQYPVGYVLIPYVFWFSYGSIMSGFLTIQVICMRTDSWKFNQHSS